MLFSFTIKLKEIQIPTEESSANSVPAHANMYLDIFHQSIQVVGGHIFMFPVWYPEPYHFALTE
jgi:hypothetical protein